MHASHCHMQSSLHVRVTAIIIIFFTLPKNWLTRTAPPVACLATFRPLVT